MATFKMSAPPARSGDSEADIDSLYAYMNEFYAHVKYVLSNIDEENIAEELLSNTEE